MNITHISIEMFLFLKFSKFKTLQVRIPTVNSSTYFYIFPDLCWLYIALISQTITALFFYSYSFSVNNSKIYDAIKFSNPPSKVYPGYLY